MDRREFNKTVLAGIFLGGSGLQETPFFPGGRTLEGVLSQYRGQDARSWCEFLTRFTPSMRCFRDFRSLGRKLFLVDDQDDSDDGVMSYVGSHLSLLHLNEAKDSLEIRRRLELQILEYGEFEDLRVIRTIDDSPSLMTMNREVLTAEDLDLALGMVRGRGFVPTRIVMHGNVFRDFRKQSLGGTRFDPETSATPWIRAGYVGWFGGCCVLRTRAISPGTVYVCPERESCGSLRVSSPARYHVTGENFQTRPVDGKFPPSLLPKNPYFSISDRTRIPEKEDRGVVKIQIGPPPSLREQINLDLLESESHPVVLEDSIVWKPIGDR